MMTIFNVNWLNRFRHWFSRHLNQLFAFCFPKYLYKQYQKFVYMHITCILYTYKYHTECLGAKRIWHTMYSTTATATVATMTRATSTLIKEPKQSIDRKGSTFLYRRYMYIYIYKYTESLALRYSQSVAWSSFIHLL